MNREETIKELIPDESKELLSPVVDQMMFLEERLDYLMTLPFIEVHPKFKERQRVTPASKQYKEFLQQYINCVKAIEYVIYKEKRLDGEQEEESPLREFFKKYVNQK